MQDAMPFLIVGAFALAGFLLHLIGRRQRRATGPVRSGDGGETGVSSWVSTSSAGDSCDGGGDCGGD